MTKNKKDAAREAWSRLNEYGYALNRNNGEKAEDSMKRHWIGTAQSQSER